MVLQIKPTGSYVRTIQLVFLLSMALVAADGLAENGAIAYAYPVDEIQIDGRLDDWPERVLSYPISQHLTGRGWSDRGHFRVAYSTRTRVVYVAVEVADDSLVKVGKGEGQQRWLTQDCHMLLLDPKHIANGSGPWSVVGGYEELSVLRGEGDFDPFMSELKDDQVQLAVNRDGSKTIYEWQVHLGELLKPGATIGMDHYLFDYDDDDQGSLGSVAMWGDFSNKNGRSARLGDVLLMPESAETGRLTGTIAWADGVEGPDLSDNRVRIRAVEHPEFWLQVKANNYRYDVELPVGRYRVSSPFDLYSDNEPNYFRLPDDLHVEATVNADQTIQAPHFEWTVIAPPSIDGDGGVLFGFDGSQGEKIDAFIQSYMHHYRVPGSSLVLFKQGKVVYQRHYGVKNAYTREPVDDQTLFDVGSITKLFAAFSAQRLIEQGKINLDQSLADYLPFDAIAHDERYRLISARHVLSHQTGFPNWAGDTEDGRLRIQFIPGTDFGYSGEGFDYLGRIMAEITDKSLETVMMERSAGHYGFGRRYALFPERRLGSGVRQWPRSDASLRIPGAGPGPCGL